MVTATYDTAANNQQIIIYYLSRNGIPYENAPLKRTYFITNKTEHNLTLNFFPSGVTPEEAGYEIISLKR